ncbi:MAG: hypothetical protein AB7S38_17685 [Vulcanimicrobiota bacterium]
MKSPSGLDKFLDTTPGLGWTSHTFEHSARLGPFVERFHQPGHPDPSHYLLRFVQAAVGARARRVNIGIRVERTRVVAEDPFELPRFDVDDLLDGLGRPGAERAALSQLAASLEASRATNLQRLDLRWSDGQTTYHLAFGLQGATVHVQPSGRGRFIALTRTHEAPPSRGLIDTRLLSRLAEHRSVAARCAFSPVPVWMDGRQINSPLWGLVKLFDQQAHETAAFVLAERFALPPEESRSVIFPLDLAKNPARLQFVQGQRQSEQAGWNAQTYFRELFHRPGPALWIQILFSERPAQLVFVVDGVTAEPLAWEKGPAGLLVIADGQSLTLEPDGLTVRRDERFEKLLALIAHETRLLYDNLRPHLAGWKLGFKGMVAGAAVGALAGAAFTPVGGLVLGAATAAATLEGRRRQRLRSLAEAFGGSFPED